MEKSEIKSAICIRKNNLGEQRGGATGTVTPIFHEDSEGWKVSKFDNFPNSGEIWISQGYDECQTNFASGELFLVSRIGQNQEERYGDPHTHALNWAIGRNCTKLDGNYQNQIAYVLKYSSNDFKMDKVISGLSHHLSKKFLWSMPNGDLVGPLISNQIAQDEENIFNYSVSLPVLPSLKSPALYMLPKWSNIDNADVLIATVQLTENADPIKIVFDWQTITKNTDSLEWVDVISEEELVKWANAVGMHKNKQNKNRLTNKHRKEFVNSVAELPKTDVATTALRLKRLGDVVDKIDIWEEQKNNFIADLFLSNNEQIQEALNQYILENSNWVERHNESFKEKRQELDEINNLIEQRSSDIDNLEKTNQGKLAEQEFTEISEKNKHLKEQENQIKEQMEIEKEKLLHLRLELSEYDELSADIDMLSVLKVENHKAKKAHISKTKEIDSLNSEIEKLISYRTEMEDNLLNSDDELVKKAAVVLPFIDRFKRKIETNVEENKLPIAAAENHALDDSLSEEEIIETLQQYFAHFEYEVSTFDLYNYLTCITQNFFTVFAGYPGVGKTSLTEHISSALGLKNRSHMISVSRGWTSDRDIIGYFNPLNNRFEESPTGLLSKLRGYEEEIELANKKLEKVAPAIFILDEANLSPIEHYWSSFMPHCETGLEKTISIKSAKSPEKILVSDNIRFLGTINIDGTTEMLSPRLLDRVPLIVIAPPKNTIDLSPSFSSFEKPLSISFCKMRETFGDIDDFNLSSDEEVTFNKIIEVLLEDKSEFGRPIIVSYRKQAAIKRFVAKMNSYEIASNDDFLPQMALDLAIKQFLLPTLSGYGVNFKKRLENLYEVIPALNKSRHNLRKIIRVGEENHHNYNFFAF